MALARPLGADVPVFIYGLPAFAQGIGNILTPVDLPERAYLVVHPPQHVQTADVFSSPDLTRNTACVKISVFADSQKINAPNNGFYKNGLFGSNDLESVVFAKHLVVEQAVKCFSEHGLRSTITGSCEIGRASVSGKGGHTVL